MKHLVQNVDEVFFMIVSKRLKAAVICFLLVFFFLLARLAEIQLFFTESFSKSNINLIQESVKQRTEEVLISDGRGSFLDRNGKELTGKKQPAVILFPFLVTQDWPVDRVSDILGMKQGELRQLLTEAKKTGDPEQQKNKTFDETIRVKYQFFEISRHLRRIYERQQRNKHSRSFVWRDKPGP